MNLHVSIHPSNRDLSIEGPGIFGRLYLLPNEALRLAWALARAAVRAALALGLLAALLPAQAGAGPRPLVSPPPALLERLEAQAAQDAQEAAGYQRPPLQGTQSRAERPLRLPRPPLTLSTPQAPAAVALTPPPAPGGHPVPPVTPPGQGGTPPGNPNPGPPPGHGPPPGRGK